jgi:hypothetical protein
MELQRRDEAFEAQSLVRSFSYEVAIQRPGDVVAGALHEQELSRQSTGLADDEVECEERMWKVYYEDASTAQYVVVKF